MVTAHGNFDGCWDADRLGQVVGNLVGNALDHGDPAAPVRLTLRGDDENVSIAVHNDGAPIPPDQLPHIFDAFRRAQGTESNGLGLGLFIASEIVRQHGGRIAVSSTSAEGTTFAVTLPRRVTRS